MTDEQKLSLAIQREIGRTGMRELGLNSLRLKAAIKDEAVDADSETKRLDRLIIASIPDDTLSHTT